MNKLKSILVLSLIVYLVNTSSLAGASIENINNNLEEYLSTYRGEGVRSRHSTKKQEVSWLMSIVET